MAMFKATSRHFSIRITVFEQPEECNVQGNRWGELYIDTTRWKFEVIGSYEA